MTVNGTAAQYRRGSFFRHELSVNNASAPAWTSVNVTADTTKLGNLLTPPASQNFSYDLDGNLTGDGVWSYIWDGENRLVEIQPLTNNAAASKRWLKFSYDWRGRRIQKTAASWDTANARWSLTVSNRFLYSGWNLIGELNATNNSLIRGYIWGLDLSGSVQGAGGVGGLIAINDAVNNASHFAAYDDMGNVVGFAKASDGSVTATYEYDPFGQLIRASGSFAASNPIRFSSKYFDDEVGLSYYGYRYYNASLGRWLNRDPIQEWGGLNIYGFCFNEPTDFVDPRGLDIGTLLGIDVGDGNATYMDSRGVYSDGPPPVPAEPQRDEDYDPPTTGLMVDNNFNGKTGGELGMEMLKEGAVALGSMLFPEEKLFEALQACKLGQKAKKAYNAAKDIAKKRGPKLGLRGRHNQTIRKTAEQLKAENNRILAGGKQADLPEAVIQTPGGYKSKRRPDILYETPAGETRAINVGKTKADGTPVTREVEAISDLEGAGIPVDYVPYDR